MRGGEEFLRIGIQSGDYKASTRVVLWRGSHEEIHQSGMMHPRYTTWLSRANCGFSGGYSVAPALAISSVLASKSYGKNDSVRLQGRSPRALRC
jgi:hypothetical protein